jgi:3-hydroxyisobutyrate dehydrogenase
VNIGLVGTGRMGQAIGLRLLEKGHLLTVWNRTPEKLSVLTRAGAKSAPSAAALVDGVDVILSILTNEDAQSSVYHTPHTGLLSGAIEGKLFIDMSTVRPHSSLALGQEVTKRGAHFVESPVGGTTGPARDGKLFAFVGAQDEAFALAEPLLQDLCRRIEHVGPVGTGCSVKLAVNLPLLVFWQAFGEALSLVSHLPLSADRLIDMLSDTPGASGGLKVRAPQFVERLSGKPPFPASFNLLSIHKDLELMRSEAQSRGADLPVVAGALKAYQEAIDQGLGDLDSIEQSLYWRNKVSS